MDRRRKNSGLKNLKKLLATIFSVTKETQVFVPILMQERSISICLGQSILPVLT